MTPNKSAMPYDPEKHHRRSIRLKEYDYSEPGGYFITLCTQDWKCLFGKVEKEQMRLSEYGHVVQACWDAIPQHYPHVMLDAFVVMPNHMHGILVITDSGLATDAVGAGLPRPYDMDDEPTRRPTLGQMVAYFKYQSTKRMNAIRRAPGTKVWQRNYWERVIRNKKEGDRIRRYIEENPVRWFWDRYHVD